VKSLLSAVLLLLLRGIQDREGDRLVFLFNARMKEVVNKLRMKIINELRLSKVAQSNFARESHSFELRPLC
jgi:hypothetical protein